MFFLWQREEVPVTSIYSKNKSTQMKLFIKKHFVSIIIIGLLTVSCFLLIKKNKELKEELDIQATESKIDYKRVSSLILEFNNDIQYYSIYLENLILDFKSYSQPRYQKLLTNHGRFLSARVIYVSLADLREQISGFDYMRNFPHYYQNDTLVDHFSRIKKIEGDLRKLILNEMDSLTIDEGYIWAQDTLILSKFDELKEEVKGFQEVIASQEW